MSHDDARRAAEEEELRRNPREGLWSAGDIEAERAERAERAEKAAQSAETGNASKAEGVAESAGEASAAEPAGTAQPRKRALPKSHVSQTLWLLIALVIIAGIVGMLF